MRELEVSKPQVNWRLVQSVRVDQILSEARAKAKAALKQKNPKLTALERAYYEVYKKGR